MIRIFLRSVDRLRHRLRFGRGATDRALGARGEDLAHRFLQSQGMQVVARNWRPRSIAGEIDLVAWEGKTLVFIEVKTRSRLDFGDPERAVDSEKRRALIAAARQYARRAGVGWENVRFDIVSIVAGADENIRHIRDAFSPRQAQ